MQIQAIEGLLPSMLWAYAQAPQRLPESPVVPSRIYSPHAALGHLKLAENSLRLIYHLPHAAWFKILSLMPKAQLLYGLRFFSKEQLLRMMRRIPKHKRIRFLIKHTALDKLIERMPIQEMMRILRVRRLDLKAMQKGFKQMPLRYLRFLMQKLTGQSAHHLNAEQICAFFLTVKKPQLLEAMKLLPYKVLQPFMQRLLEDDPMLLEALSERFLARVFDGFNKPKLMASFAALDEEEIINILGLLPEKYLAQVVNQVDLSTLSGYLLSEHSTMLLQLANAA